MAAAAAVDGLDAAIVRHGEPVDEDEDDNGRYYEAFERQYAADHSWESLQEDEQGFLRPVDATAELRARRQRAMSAAQSARIRKGMIRYVLLVVDLSHAASANDLRPSRLSVMSAAARSFIRRFFELNPLGQLGLVVLQGGIAQKLTDLSGSPEAQIAMLQQYGMNTGGDASLQNGLELCLELMADVPPYGHREVVALMAALSIVDPGRVEDSIQACKAAHIRVSVIGVSAEVHVLRHAAQVTGGTYGVSLNESHLSELLLAHAPPPPAPPGQLTAELVRMGFPQRGPMDGSSAVFVGEVPVLAAGGFTCPRCKSRTQELPAKCHVCGLMLISSPHLARSYHHLFPVPPFEEVAPHNLAAAAAEAAAAAPGLSSSSSSWHEPGGQGSNSSNPQQQQQQQQHGEEVCCYGCLKQLGGQKRPGAVAGAQVDLVLRCGQCRQLYCFDCDAFIHETLHNCPSCECCAGAAQAAGQQGGGAGGAETSTPAAAAAAAAAGGNGSGAVARKHAGTGQHAATHAVNGCVTHGS